MRQLTLSELCSLLCPIIKTWTVRTSLGDNANLLDVDGALVISSGNDINVGGLVKQIKSFNERHEDLVFVGADKLVNVIYQDGDIVLVSE